MTIYNDIYLGDAAANDAICKMRKNKFARKTHAQKAEFFARMGDHMIYFLDLFDALDALGDRAPADVLAAAERIAALAAERSDRSSVMVDQGFPESVNGVGGACGLTFAQGCFAQIKAVSDRDKAQVFGNPAPLRHSVEPCPETDEVTGFWTTQPGCKLPGLTVEIPAQHLTIIASTSKQRDRCFQRGFLAGRQMPVLAPHRPEPTHGKPDQRHRNC